MSCAAKLIGHRGMPSTVALTDVARLVKLRGISSQSYLRIQKEFGGGKQKDWLNAMAHSSRFNNTMTDELTVLRFPSFQVK